MVFIFLFYTQKAYDVIFSQTACLYTCYAIFCLFNQGACFYALLINFIVIKTILSSFLAEKKLVSLVSKAGSCHTLGVTVAYSTSLQPVGVKNSFPHGVILGS